jgi:hypothetical protein
MAKRKKLTGVPVGTIKYLVGNLHVGTPDTQVRELFRGKCQKAGASERIAERCGRVAVGQHHRNVKLYIQVQRGGFGAR